jgi:hypothetical protein
MCGSVKGGQAIVVPFINGGIMCEKGCHDATMPSKSCHKQRRFPIVGFCIHVRLAGNQSFDNPSITVTGG